MKKILLRYKNRLITIAILLTVVQVWMIYIANFQSTAPLIGVLSNLSGCLVIYIATILPFLVTRRAVKDSLLSKEFPGWKLGVCINLLFVALLLLYSILNLIVQLVFVKAVLNNLYLTVLLLGSIGGALFILFIGLCAGWAAQKIYGKAVSVGK